MCRERGPLRGVGLVGRHVRGRVPRARAAVHPNELVGELRTAVAQPPLPHLAPARVAEAPGEGGPVVLHGAEHVAPHVRVPEDRGGGVAARRAEAAPPAAAAAAEAEKSGGGKKKGKASKADKATVGARFITHP